MTKVSIIVPVYNGEQYLSTCLDSILAQTLEDIEVNRKEISTRKFIEDVKSDLKQMTKSKGIGLDLEAEKLFKEKIKIDSYIIYRILENII